MREPIGALARIGLAQASYRVKLPNPARPPMILWPYGRTPAPTFPSWSRPRPN